MPRVKFDYIVSFSSEDPEHPASNLLSWEVNKKKWLCAAGETSASVVLQLEKAVQIGTVAVGAHHAALVEVLVGRSETPAEPYQVLVASCVFLSPSESRKAEGAAVERVRSFTGTEGAWLQRWDRLRILISQPYNKHCKFGVSFVHVFSPEAVPTRPLSPREVPARSSLVTALEGLSSDEEEFKPGELFAQHKIQTGTNTTTDTGSQIRRASSQLLRTSTEARLVKARVPAPAPRYKHTLTEDSAQHDAATRNVRTIDAATPADIRDTKRKRDISRELDTDHKRRKDSSNERDKASDNESGTSRDTRRTRERRDQPRDTSRYNRKENRERTKTDMSKNKPCARARRVLEGVVCVLSGYENPRRAAVRSTALALGARVRPDWGPDCTHLICAFPKTPKLVAVRAGRDGARVPAVLADWVEQCARLRRRLPEEWFSTEPARRVPVPEGSLDTDGDEEDTDDEIERDPPVRDTHRSADGDDRIQTSVSVSEEETGSTTDVECRSDDEDDDEVGVDASRALPPLLRDMVFVSAGELLDRYVRAYGGTVIYIPVEEAEGEVYALCADGAGAAGRGGARRLRLRWLWRAHQHRRLPPLTKYLID